MRKQLLLVSIIAIVSLTPGCNRDSGPPPPLSATQIGPEFKKGFADAPQATRDVSAEVVSALQASNYVAAFGAAQALCARPDMTKSQQALASRALLTVNQLLQAAQASGDKEAAAVLQLHRSSR
jgi:hypothetical protein